MNTGNTGAVFFLGTRAHYQVLNQPDRPFDIENGNASTETIYQNSTANDLWRDTDAQNNEVRSDCNCESPEIIANELGRDTDAQNNEVRSDCNCESPEILANGLWRDTDAQNNEVRIRSDCNCESPEVIVNDDNNTGVKRRSKRRPSETALCEDIKPAQLNASNSGTPKSKGRRTSLLGAIASLARRKRRLQSHSACYLRRLETALTTCTYRESCRCFECQSRYFECDDDDQYSSEDDEYEFAAQYYASQMVNTCQHDDDDEVFVDTVPGDNTSTDMLLDQELEQEPKSQSDFYPNRESIPTIPMDIEVAAGTPIVLNYLLHHPITCSIQ